MDPNATLKAIAEFLADGDREQAREYAGYLIEWLRKGGFVPSNWDEYDDAALFVCQTITET